jgi:hypothetical protein
MSKKVSVTRLGLEIPIVTRKTPRFIFSGYTYITIRPAGNNTGNGLYFKIKKHSGFEPKCFFFLW